jgi:hypothetical protein
MRAGIVVVIWLHLCFDRERSEERLVRGLEGKGRERMLNTPGEVEVQDHGVGRVHIVNAAVG